MPNVNKVVFGNTVIIDLTTSTLNSADQLAEGVTAFDRSGTLLTGTATPGTSGTQYWLWRDTSGVVRISATDPTEEPTYAESIMVYAPTSSAAIVGTAIVGQAIVG